MQKEAQTDARAVEGDPEGIGEVLGRHLVLVMRLVIVLVKLSEFLTWRVEMGVFKASVGCKGA
jgi:hypothetical protein